ncbi:hypothetical protein GOC91_03305 [Sinorhizobium medicae]|nr:hypothetical protein [Sinorhizobium medicae]MDX0625261.1 hypothetical protein [Sinorhizobium medicae]MDX0877930.1 hypothetical protein [Sinorhizobium medicae]MDX1224632.1 hypothetical protein [Sinorhizobium medicae]
MSEKKSGKSRDEDRFPRTEILGRDFWEVPPNEAREMFPALSRSLSQSQAEVLLQRPAWECDDELEFPEQPDLEAFSCYLRSGVALHQLELTDPLKPVHDSLSALQLKTSTPDEFISECRRVIEAHDGTSVTDLLQKLADVFGTGLSARQLKIFAPDEFLSECKRVLEAHDWMTGAFLLTDRLLQKLTDVRGTETISDAQTQFGDNWDAYLLEVAACHFAKPFSRLWYAANMYALYFAHKDDFRLGYLWNEYQSKMRHERFALRHEQVVQKNRESGKKGGQGGKKSERYARLDRLADAEFTKLHLPTDKELCKCARRLARQHDEKADVKLFVQNGRALSPKWYEEWLAHFRTRKKLEKQMLKRS